MIAENIRTWEEKVRAEGIQKGRELGMQLGMQQYLLEIVWNMVQAGLPDEQIISIADISSEELAAIKLNQSRH